MSLVMLLSERQEPGPDLPGGDALAAALAFYLLLGLVLGGLCVYLYRRRSGAGRRKKNRGQEDPSGEG